MRQAFAGRKWPFSSLCVAQCFFRFREKGTSSGHRKSVVRDPTRRFTNVNAAVLKAYSITSSAVICMTIPVRCNAEPNQ